MADSPSYYGPAGKWNTDSLSLFILQQSISGTWRDIHLGALVHPVREEKWLSSGLMPSSSTALMADKSKVYITALCVNTGTHTAWQMGQSCLLIVDSWLVSFACQNDHITNVCTYKCSHSIIVFLPLGHQKLNYSSLWVNKYAQGCVHCLATVASNINMHSQAWPPCCV